MDSALHNSTAYRVPDFLVVIKRGGRDLPFLVEVKTDNESKLNWRPDYLQSLRTFANMINLPMLIAWKHNGLWVLADSALFVKKAKNYHLTFDDAVKNSLMSELFGNHWIKFAEGFYLELKMRILDQIDTSVKVLPEGNYHVVIEDAGVWTNKGRLDRKDERSLWWFLIAALEEDRFDRVGDIMTHQFVAKAEGMFNLSDILISQLVWGKEQGAVIDWLTEIRKGLPIPSVDLDQLLTRTLELGVMRYVLKQVPEVVPDFLR